MNLANCVSPETGHVRPECAAAPILQRRLTVQQLERIAEEMAKRQVTFVEKEENYLTIISDYMRSVGTWKLLREIADGTRLGLMEAAKPVTVLARRGVLLRKREAGKFRYKWVQT